MDKNIEKINLDEALELLMKNKSKIENLKLQLQEKEEENQKLKKIIEEMSNKKTFNEKHEESDFDILFEPYDYFGNGK